jgi:hypothetical protein
MNTTTIGIDVAKSAFQVSQAARSGQIVERKRLSRAQFQRFLAQQPPAEIVMGACATAHDWARRAHEHGHDVALLPAMRKYSQRRSKGERPAKINQHPALLGSPLRPASQGAARLLRCVCGPSGDRPPASAVGLLCRKRSLRLERSGSHHSGVNTESIDDQLGGRDIARRSHSRHVVRSYRANLVYRKRKKRLCSARTRNEFDLNGFVAVDLHHRA